jgi:hypothetical protein
MHFQGKYFFLLSQIAENFVYMIEDMRNHHCVRSEILMLLIIKTVSSEM